MRKLPTRKLLGAIIAGALFLPSQAFTLGLGEIEVSSALNQKLKADIELLSATPEDAESILVKLASRKEFSRAGLDRPYSLNDLRFKSIVKDGVPYIVVSSSSPIREPFLNFLVEVDWPNGHLLREYTVLLDPPVFMTQSASTASAPVNQNTAAADNNNFRPGSGSSTNVVPVAASAAAVSSRPSSSQSQAPSDSMNQAAVTSNFVPAPVLQQQTTINQPAGTYKIKAGDTAWSLADAMRPDQSVSVEQMMVAMLRANPESFIKENINGLKRGYILRVPDYEQIAAVNQVDARALVREQAALWKQYQQSLAGGQPVSAMEAGDEGVSSTAGGAESVTTEDDAYLEIVSAGSGTSTISGKDPTQMSAKELRAELAYARERVETERVEKEALQGRVENLERHVDKMKGMLSIEDNELSEVQSLNMPAEGGAEEAADPEMQAEEELQNALAEETMTEEGVVADGVTDESIEMDAESDVASEDELSEQVSDAEGEAEEVVFTDEADGEQAEDGMAQESAAEMSEGADTATENFDASEPVVTEPTGPLSKLLNNPILLAGIAGALLLLLGLIGLVIKKRRNASGENSTVAVMNDDLDSFADDIAAENDVVEVDSLAGDSVANLEEDDFDSEATMILDAADDTVIIDAAPTSDAAEEDEEPRDDVIAEADVYLAYGIYQQAEDLLTQAIADNPERDDYRVKLAETHYASKNVEAFTEVATELQERAESDDTPAWKKVMVMGQDMCADNPMFQGSMVGGLDVGSLAPNAPEMDFDLGIDEVGGDSSPDLDLSLDDDALELPEMDTESSEVGVDLDLDATQMLEAEVDELEDAVADTVEEVDELEFDLSDTGAVEAESAKADDEFSLDIDASELDIDITEEAVEETTDVEESIDLGDIDIGLDLDTGDSDDDVVADEIADVGEIDLDFGLDDTDTATEEAPAEEMLTADEEEIGLDLTDEVESLDMDLGDFDEAEEPATEAPAPSMDMSVDDGDFDLSSLDDVDEISTKLDLARAYLDMGDHDGTRGILDEVLAEGNEEQKQEASDLMTKLD